MTERNNLSFIQFTLSNISVSIIAGLFTYRIINSFLDNILFPYLDLTILPDKKFLRLTQTFKKKHNNITAIPTDFKYLNKSSKYTVRFGLFLKDLIIWIIVMFLLYLIYNLIQK